MIKKCRDCSQIKKIGSFGIMRRYESVKGKGVSIHYSPYCNKCQYKRVRKSLLRSPESVEKMRKYQKKYWAKWQKKNGYKRRKK